METPKKTMFGLPVKEIFMGETEMSFQDIKEIVDSLQSDYTAISYHVFDNNCNHFSNEFLQLILDKGVPQEILNQAKEFRNTPIGSLILSM